MQLTQTTNIVLAIIQKNVETQKALKKCARMVTNHEVQVFFRSIILDFRRINSILLDTIQPERDVGQMLHECIRERFDHDALSKERWMVETCIFPFDTEYTLLEELVRALTVISLNYKKIGIESIDRILAEIWRNQLIYKEFEEYYEKSA